MNVFLINGSFIRNTVEMTGFYDLTDVARERGLGQVSRYLSWGLRPRLYAVTASGGYKPMIADEPRVLSKTI